MNYIFPNLEDIVITLLTIYIIYKVILGSFETIKYLFIILILLVLYFRGLKLGGLYRRIINNENVIVRNIFEEIKKSCVRRI